MWDEVSEWNSFSKNTVGSQFVRAADSIGANIAESFGRYHYKDKINFLYYARGSLYETKWWIARSLKRTIVAAEKGTNIGSDIDQLLLKLNAYIKCKKGR